MTTFQKQIATLSSIWFALFLLSQYALGFKHWPVSYLNIANYELFLMIFLLAIAISIKERYYPIAFIFIAAMAFAYLVGFFVMFTGQGFEYGDSTLQYKLWGCRKIAIHLLIFLNVVYITICQIGRDWKRIFRILISAVLGFLVTYFFFRDIVLNPDLLFQRNIIDRLLNNGISMNALSIGIIGIYSVTYYFGNKPFSSHINFLIVGLFFFLLTDIYDNYYLLQAKTGPPLSQVLLFMNLIYFILVLGHKLYFMQSSYGSFWEMALGRKGRYKFDIIPKLGVAEKWALHLIQYFRPTHRAILSVVLIILSLVLQVLYFPYSYTTGIFIVVIIFMAVLIIYLYHLARKKIKKDFILEKIKNRN